MTSQERPRKPGADHAHATHVPADVPADPPAEETVWAVDDLDATWWDDVWPFRDDRGEESAGSAGKEPAPVSARSSLSEAAPSAGSPVVEDDRAPLPAPWAPLVAGGEGPWWRRRLVWLSALAVVSLVAAGLVVLGGRHASEGPSPLGDSAFEPPVPLRANTSYVRSRVLPSGDLVVTHWIRTGAPVDSVVLRIPTTRGLARASVTASQLVLAADGAKDLAVPITDAGTGAQTLIFPYARSVYLQYRLSGVVESTGPGRRALARLTSLAVVVGGRSVRTTQVVVGANVLALACTSGRADSTPVPCGSQDPASWSVRLTPRAQPTRVMAQVDLS